MLTEKERTDRNYHLFWLNGSYNRELVGMHRRLFEIEQSMRNHPDDPIKAAHECNFTSNDPKYPADKKMLIAKASLELETERRWKWKEQAAIDDFISSLPAGEQDFILFLFDDNMTLEQAGKWSGISRCRQAADYRLRRILERYKRDEVVDF